MTRQIRSVEAFRLTYGRAPTAAEWRAMRETWPHDTHAKKATNTRAIPRYNCHFNNAVYAEPCDRCDSTCREN